ncbi:MAG: DUF167 domain-containing protein [bacterium]|nr:DUF167 domain-containing protein [bacterium]
MISHFLKTFNQDGEIYPHTQKATKIRPQVKGSFLLQEARNKYSLAREGEGVYLRIKARPGANATKVRQILKDEDGDIMKIDVGAPAVKGKANLELIKFLAREFAVAKSNLKIISGAGDRLKLVKIVKTIN